MADTDVELARRGFEAVQRGELGPIADAGGRAGVIVRPLPPPAKSHIPSQA